MAATLDTMSITAPRWMKREEYPTDSRIAARCTIDFLQRAIGHLGELEVVRAEVITSGQYPVPPLAYDLPPIPLPIATTIEALPHFCDVGVELRGPGGHVA